MKDFADVVVGGLFAIHFSKMCVGVDLPECVEKWQGHPQCTLDIHKFEESEYSLTSRTNSCSYLVSQRYKQCANFSR